MNLDFGILWIEDSFSAEEEASLRRRVRDVGFVARIHSIPNGDGIEKVAREHQLFHRFDLILLDYRLEGEMGDELAIKVRDLFPSTAILFYSGSVKDEDQLRMMIARKQVEGVYCSHRSRFIARTGALIEQTARSLDRLSGMRGLAMRVVAECDELMKSAVLSLSDQDGDCEKKVSDLDKDVIQYLVDLKEGYEASTRGNLVDRLSTRAVDSAKLFKHFRRLTQIVTKKPAEFGLNESQVDRLRELRRDSAQFDQDVLNRRNILGHVIEVEGEAGWSLQGSSEISVADFPEIRQAFAAHIDAFREIIDIVQFLDAQKTE